MEIENMLDKIGFNETHIEEIADKIGKGNGFAYLAEKEIARGHAKEALVLVEKGLKLDPDCIWLMRLRVSILRESSPGNHSEIWQTLDDYTSLADKKYDVELSFELAKENYMSGRVKESYELFRQLSINAKNHPRRLVPRDKQDRWIEDGRPRRLTGTITIAPTEDRYGRIQITFPMEYRGVLVVRKRDVQFKDPRIGDRVTFEIVFNMLGPEASKVRRI